MSQEEIRAYWEKSPFHLDLSHHTSSYRSWGMNNLLCCWANKAASHLSIFFDRPHRWWAGGRSGYQCMVCLRSYSKWVSNKPCCLSIKSILKAESKRRWAIFIFFSEMEADITFMMWYVPPPPFYFWLPVCPLCVYVRNNNRLSKEKNQGKASFLSV